MKKIVMLFALIGSILMTNCVNEEPVNCYLPMVETTGNSPVISGGTISLSVPTSAEEGVTFSWTGPNGFSSSLQNPIINNATSLMSGDYKLKVRKGLCESIESIVSIEVIANPVACNPTNNSISYSVASQTPSTFSSVNTSISTGNYILSANGSDDLIIEFANSNTPTPGLYTIKQQSSFLMNNEVSISLYKNGYLFYAISDNVLALTLENDKLTFTFCDVLFNSTQSYPFEVKGSAKIIKN